MVRWLVPGDRVLFEIIEAEQCPTPHVQGHQTNGHRLCNEERSSIIALMRGGEPMALDVNEASPQTMFIHAACGMPKRYQTSPCASADLSVKPWLSFNCLEFEFA